MKNTAVIIDGARTAFMRSGGHFADLMTHELGRYAINGLMEKTDIGPEEIEHVCMGTVIADPHTSNVAREIVLESILPISTPAHTVTMACISSNMAATSLVEMIQSGRMECGIAGGAETFSDLPIRLSRSLRKLLLKAKKAKGPIEALKAWRKFRPSDIRLDIPDAKEFSTGFTMGQAGDQLAAKFSISRADADAYALMSHLRADAAWRAGHYDDQVIPVKIPPKFATIERDDGPRPDSSPKQLADLLPSFTRYGINTAANSSFFTDGASAVLLGSKNFCEFHGLKPLASIEDYLYRAGDPEDELLLGPALTVPALLSKNELKASDIDVWEIHEAFAGQVLANLKAMASLDFCKNRLGLSRPAEIPMEKINLWGGSLSLGHPFGATGTRLLLTAASRLKREDGKYAIVTGCAASGLGSAILLKRELL